MTARSQIAVGLGRRRLRAVQGSAEPGGVQVHRALDREIPEQLRAAEPKRLGAWVGRTLREAGFPRGTALVALPREQLGLKRIILPTTDDAELPGMTGLAMRRELSFDATTAVLDFVPLARTDSNTTVLAAALPRRVLDWTVQVVQAAGLRIEIASPRTVGAAALISSLPAEAEGSTLIIDITGDSVEYGVVTNGVVRFSRGAELGRDDPEDQLARAVVTETRRTWMSYRIVEEAEDIDRAVIIGPESVTAEVAASIGQMLQVPATVLGEHPLIGTGSRSLATVWPLAGLLLEAARGRPMLDLVHPRRPPDVGARRRRVALAVTGAVIIALAAATMASMVSMKRLDRRLATLQSRAEAATPLRLRHKRDVLKVEHLRQWQSVRVDWLTHLEQLVTLAPPPDRLVLDGWSGSLEFRGVRYDRKLKWSAPHGIRITVDGEAADRATADAFRAALVRTDLYRTSSSGADAAGGRRLPFGFTYTLQSTGQEPAAKPAAGPSPDRAGLEPDQESGT